MRQQSARSPREISVAKGRGVSTISNVKIRIFVSAALALLAYGLWIKNHGSPTPEDAAAALSRTKIRDFESIGDREASSNFRTKVADREPVGPRATHAPERLKEFMLPEVVINGLTLGEALQKLMDVYEETCGKTGETPLHLTFDLPPGSTKKLKLKLNPRNFNSSVQLIATYAGMKVSRTKTAYHFEPFPDERKQVNKTVKVPPDFASRLIDQAEIPPLSCFEQFKNPSFVRVFGVPPLGDILKMSGVDLDPSTRLSVDPSGSLTLETTSGADAAAIAALTDTLGSEKPIQHKFVSKVVEIPADFDWTPPDVTQMSSDQVQSMMREIAVTQGAGIASLPSAVTRPGQNATVEILRELIIPTDDSATHFEKHDIGKVVSITGSPLGFGHDTTVHYTDTTGGPDGTGKSIIPINRTDLADSGYSSDGGSRLVVQTRPDGSKTLLIVTSQLIDSTGRLVNDGQ